MAKAKGKTFVEAKKGRGEYEVMVAKTDAKKSGSKAPGEKC